MTEVTSTKVGTLAGKILNGKNLKAAEVFLQDLATNALTTEDARGHALVLLGSIQAMRSLAASALTQRPAKKK
jgi:hypothetical protein